MMRKFFVTDGVRGPANEEPMTAETALKIAMAAGRYFAPETGKQRPLAVIGLSLIHISEPTRPY